LIRRRRVQRSGHWRAKLTGVDVRDADDFFGSATHSEHISSIGVRIKRCVYMATVQETVARLLRLRPIASVDILQVCESNGSILFTSVVEVEGASCQEDKPTIEILGDG
jgi:hypothetical protein